MASSLVKPLDFEKNFFLESYFEFLIEWTFGLQSNQTTRFWQEFNFRKLF